MSKVVVLGGCGAVGRVAVRTLAAHETFSEVVIADIDGEGARALARDIGSQKVSIQLIDVSDEGQLEACVTGCDVVLNCSGPFYKYVKPILRVVIACGVDYVDVCDDVDVTQEILEWDGQARAAGVRCLIGMGNSPGITNLLARLASDHLLDETESVDIYHAHGGEENEGAGVIAHRLHGMSIPVPMYLEGQLTSVGFFEPEGLALRTRTDFHLLGKGIPVYPYPHPEQVTLPRYIRTRRVTNRGTVLPDEYFQLTLELARLGLTARNPLKTHGREVVPLEVTVPYLQQARDILLEQTAFGGQRGCTKVVVKGLRHGQPTQYAFSMASTEQALGEGTGIPAAMGAILMKNGKVADPGVFPPEGGISPLDFLGLVQPVMSLIQQGRSFDGFLVERTDSTGKIEKIDLPFF